MFARIPFIRIVLCFLGGILLEIFLPNYIPLPTLIFGCFSFLFLFTVLFFYEKLAGRFWFKAFLGVIIGFILFLFGIIQTRNSSIFNDQSHIYNQSQNTDLYIGTINSEVVEKSKSWKFEVLLNRSKLNGNWTICTGKALIYIRKDTSPNKLNYGDKILLKGNLLEISAPQNPNEFNLKRYYYFHGISHRAFLKSNQVYKIGYQPENKLIEYAILLRKKSDQVFRKYLKSDRERTIASALILGIKGDLDEEIETAYASTGTMHVLAVSGLHVGIIYMILKIIFSFLTKIRHGVKIRAIFLIMLLWAYAFITGLCPSVLRAVAMFSTIIIAESLGKKASIFNTLSIAAFVLLVYNPFFITEVGFQLSFLAVAGIVYIQPKIYELFEVKNKILDWFWSVTCVSIAAQMATFPLGLLYFHQFPNYFLLSNLVVIPAAIGIMSIGLVFITIHFVDFFGFWLGKLVENLVWLLNQVIIQIEKFPYSTIQGISITIFETWLIYLIIVAIFVFFETRKWVFFVNIAILITTFCGIQVFEIYQQNRQQLLIVYQISNGSVVDLISGRVAKTIATEKTLNDKQKMLFSVYNHRWSRGLEKIDRDVITFQSPLGQILIFEGQKILIVDKPILEYNKFKIKQQVDLVILQNNAIQSTTILDSYISTKKIIVDGSNNDRAIRNLEKSNLSQQKMIFTSKTGAFMKELSN